jgi:hypothetical protein
MTLGEGPGQCTEERDDCTWDIGRDEELLIPLLLLGFIDQYLTVVTRVLLMRTTYWPPHAGFHREPQG